MLAKLTETLRGARKIEIFMLLALVAALGLLMLPGDADKSSATPLEERLSAALSGINGAGEVRVVINETEAGVAGVLVVAQGAEDMLVRLKLTAAVEAVVGVDISRIEIVEGL